MKLQEKTSLRETIIIGISIIAIFLVIFLIVMKTQYKSYSKILNDKINIIISKVVEKYPEVKGSFLFETCMPFIYFKSGKLSIYISLDTSNPSVRYIDLTSDYYEEVIRKYMCEIK